ncbi:MAG: IS30 family transposase [Opitutales bacterium]|nr:IS30 family transposase [Opitutales bacterium]
MAERSRFGDWEGDLIMGKNHKGAILTLVERRSKYLCATYLSGKDAKATKNGVIKLLRGMNVKTITFDNGKEFAYHEDISKKLRSEIYFAPHTLLTKEVSMNTQIDC